MYSTRQVIQHGLIDNIRSLGDLSLKPALCHNDKVKEVSSRDKANFAMSAVRYSILYHKTQLTNSNVFLQQNWNKSFIQNITLWLQMIVQFLN